MEELTLKSTITVARYEELKKEDKELIDAAKKMTDNSYAPYSKFKVGAALRLANGQIVTGSNQENAAYPSGICAERTTLFFANSQYPDQAVTDLAIAAQSDGIFTDSPCPPCGACRQVIKETEDRYNQSIRILLYGQKAVYIIKGIKDLLPLQFNASFMK